LQRSRHNPAPLHGILTVLFVLLAAACGDDAPTEATPATLTGPWSGAVEDDVAGDGVISLTFAQSGASVSGSWSTEFPAASTRNGDGAISGILSGSTLTATLFVSSDPACTLTLTGVVAGSAQTTMAGGYTSDGCDSERAGSFTATRD
jgi:hypothetical protein